MKKIIASIIAAVVVVGIIVAVLVLNNPKFVFEQSLDGALKALGKRSEFATLNKSSNCGSILLEGTIDDEELLGEGNEVSFGGKVYFQSGKKPEDAGVYMEDLNFTLSSDGEEAEFKASAYFSTEYMYVADCNLMDGTYGLVRGDLQDEFMDSDWIDEIFADVNDGEELKESIGNVLGYIDDKKEQSLIKDASEKLEEYVKLLEDLLNDYAEFEMDVRKVDCGDERVKSRVVTMTLDQDAVAAILEEMIAALREDDELRTLVMDHGEELLSLFEDYLEVLDEDFDMDDTMEEVEEFYDNLFSKSDWRETIYDLKSQEFEVKIQVASALLTPTLRKLTVILDGDGSRMQEYVLNIGSDGVKNSNHFSFEANGVMLFAYDITENSKSKYASALSVPMYNPEKGRDEMTAVATLEVNHDKEKYTLTLIDSSWDTDFDMDTYTEEYYFREDKIVATGKLADDGKVIKITLDQVKFLYDDDETENESYSFDISLTINVKDKMPDVKDSSKVKSIFEMDMEDFEEIAKNFEEEFSDINLGGKAEDTPVNPWGDSENNDPWGDDSYNDPWNDGNVEFETEIAYEDEDWYW